MLLLFGVVGSLWVGIPIYRQQAAIRAIERLGGEVAVRPRGPEWIRDWWDEREGTSPFDEVIAVDMGLERVSDADLKPVRAFSELMKLNLDGSQITDAGLASLAGLEKLESLNLGDTRVTEAGLARLRGMKRLEDLRLPEIRLTENGLKELCSHPQLKVVTLSEGSELANPELVDVAEARGFDLYLLGCGDFQRTTKYALRGRRKVSLVYCSVSDGLRQDGQSVDYDIAKHVAYNLNGKKIKVFDPDRVYNWLDNHDGWRKTSEIGAAFKADFIVHIDVMNYSIDESDDKDLYRARAECVVNVVKMDDDKNDGYVIYTVPIITNFPQNGSAILTDSSHAEFKKQFLLFLSNEVGRFFCSTKVYPARTTESVAKTAANDR
ncbi:MAG: hypothetical protein HY290_31095 [Planctomycetia bacterium]|nr:hypothetical protein [Planctomycetia bacterium]